MKKIILIATIVFSNSVFAQNDDIGIMDFGQRAIKTLGNKPAYLNAAATTVTLNNYAICTILELSLMASEIKGSKFKKETVQTMGLLWAYLDFFRKSEIARGVPESVLDNSWKPYQQESLMDAQGYFNKYGVYCANVANKVSQNASGK